MFPIFPFFSLTLYLDGEELEAELMEKEDEVAFKKKQIHHLLIFLEFLSVCLYQDNFLFFCLSASISDSLTITFKDDVTAVAKLNPTDRVQHVVCEAKNEVRKVLKSEMNFFSNVK